MPIIRQGFILTLMAVTLASACYGRENTKDSMQFPTSETTSYRVVADDGGAEMHHYLKGSSTKNEKSDTASAQAQLSDNAPADEERGFPGLSKLKTLFQKFPRFNKAKTAAGTKPDLNTMKTALKKNPELRKSLRSIKLTESEAKKVNAFAGKHRFDDELNPLEIVLCVAMLGLIVAGSVTIEKTLASGDLFSSKRSPANFKPCLMVAFTSGKIAGVDGWMLRRVLENKKKNYNF